MPHREVEQFTDQIKGASGEHYERDRYGEAAGMA